MGRERAANKELLIGAGVLSWQRWDQWVSVGSESAREPTALHTQTQHLLRVTLAPWLLLSFLLSFFLSCLLSFLLSSFFTSFLSFHAASAHNGTKCLQLWTWGQHPTLDMNTVQLQGFFFFNDHSCINGEDLELGRNFKCTFHFSRLRTFQSFFVFTVVKSKIASEIKPIKNYTSMSRAKKLHNCMIFTCD